MNRLTLSALLLVASIGFSTNAMAAEEEKTILGVIDWREVLFSTEEAKKENERIQKSIQSDEDKLKALESKIAADQEKLEKNAKVLSEKQQEKLVADLQANLQEFQTLGQALQQKVRTEEQEFIQRQTQKIQPIVEKIATDKGLHAIIQRDVVLYGRLTLDITDDVIKELNK